MSQAEELRMLNATPQPRFEAADSTWMTHLEREGYVVIAGLADEAELCKAKCLLWEFLEAQTGWRRADPSTWSDEEFERIGSVQNGLCNGGGIGQSDFVWYMRTLPSVRTIFERIWKTSDLLVSF